MQLFWTSEATQDRDEIYNYIEADNPAAALALDELFAEKAGRLLDHPCLGRFGRIAGTRELVAHRNHILVDPHFSVRSGLPNSAIVKSYLESPQLGIDQQAEVNHVA